jgi:ethanolamine ammonia-lyase large subunit
LELIRKVELIRYNNGENARQLIDRYIADGYNMMVSYKIGAVRKYYLRNELTNSELQVSSYTRKYAELVIDKAGQVINNHKI